MYRVLRIICCVICALLLAACVFIFVYLGTVWGIVTVVAAAAFFALTMLFKGLQEDYEKKHHVQSNEPASPAAEETKSGISENNPENNEEKNN